MPLFLGVLLILPGVGPARDRDGHPLPAGAVARLGSTLLRGAGTEGLTFSPDGRQLLATDGRRLVSWDADTGRPRPPVPLVAPEGAGGAVALAGGRVV